MQNQLKFLPIFITINIGKTLNENKTIETINKICNTTKKTPRNLFIPKKLIF